MTEPPIASGGPVVDRTALVAHLGRYLEVSSVSDFCPNGLQVEGRAEIRKVVTGVSACTELFRRAREAQADAIIVHHGIFWRGEPQVLTGVRYSRVAELIHSGINLLAYHLPLDRHPEVGNNAVAARLLGLGELEPFGAANGLDLGYKGHFSRPLGFERFLSLCEQVFGQPPLAFAHGPALLSSVGVVSGAGGRCVHQAIDAGLDAFVTGEAEEWSMNLVREAGIHFVAAGHHATERLGVRALGDHLRKTMGVTVEFIDVPNPV